ncbi:6.3 kDa small hydrophobic protein [Grapevine leafroll-associated virus 2]|uniref:Small hydrophobic protein n=1 Tax=Grapevine leafroll-associated virus 2 TaxID=64003 RepID=Q49IH1_9CLOS|nr:6.3 kDa small hydrophobic protein [Grapevine leafroll-associated virus 2]AAX31605.1 6.3 kDa small hydrophobic protein [Grapevine leafroll-associated virus 2]QBZ78563.1 small hydrophobic protein [Grapevine leafroll-associated virus 2]UFQ72691.1 6 kDa small hydrophobic protein [Grapevine leafroll-associated virus 2]UFQ72701.1 6 kDa small hydrophobic protein [Grapevine leafroll-associated virus 2]ULT60369.1 6 kDa small hydrophobic protein [Grapevine leafroll-associated virus 2]
MNQVLQFECLFLLNLAVFAVTFIFILLVIRVIKSFRQKSHEAPNPVVRSGGFSTVV